MSEDPKEKKIVFENKFEDVSALDIEGNLVAVAL